MLKSRRCRECLVLVLAALWGGWSCTRLTEVDWSRIGAVEPGQGGEPSTPDGGRPGSDDGGTAANDGGVAGAAEEGGAAGESGASVGGSAGTGGGGMAGGGTGGGGTGGGGTGGGGTGGGGTGGGGTGAAGEGPIVIIDGPIESALVLYDGGADGPNGDYEGRAGLDQRCAAAKTALALPHANSVAFISVGPTDFLQNFPQDRQVPANKQIVSKTKVLIAESWIGLFGDVGVAGRPNVSLKTAGVVPSTAKRWLSGSLSSGAVDLSNTCEGWTRSTHDRDIQGRYGSVSSVSPKWLSDLRVSCETGGSHVLCLAF